MTTESSLARGFLQIAREIKTADGGYRGEAKEDAGAQGDGEREGEHANIQRNTIEVRKGGRARGEDGMNGGISCSERSNAAENAEQQAFGEELAREARARRTERSADGCFAKATAGAGHKEVGDVGAADQKHEANTSEKTEEGGFNFADRVGLKREDRNGEVAQGSASAELVDLCGGRVHLGLCR